MTRSTSTSRRNLGAVILVIAGAYALFATLANAVSRAIPDFPTNAVALAIVVSVVVIRVGVVRGLARWALPLAILLTTVSIVFPSVPNAPESDWWDIPHGLGIVLLGVAYWRAGVHTPPSVPEGAESLAE